jgi:hypothetical protein
LDKVISHGATTLSELARLPSLLLPVCHGLSGNQVA